MVGYDSTLYRAASKLYNYAVIALVEGPGMAQALTKLAQAEHGPAKLLRFRNLDHPIHVRPGTPDIATVVNNIVRKEYGAFAPATNPAFMIDAGAYIGDSSAYFASKYQTLKIVALEPDASNYTMARRNLAAYGERIVLLNKALGSAPGTVKISGAHDGAALGQTGTAVEATTVPEIMRFMGQRHIDILKMDIEGAEADVLDQTADSWLDRVGLLIIELHGPLIAQKVMATLNRNGFQATQYRSLWYCARVPLHA